MEALIRRERYFKREGSQSAPFNERGSHRRFRQRRAELLRRLNNASSREPGPLRKYEPLVRVRIGMIPGVAADAA